MNKKQIALGKAIEKLGSQVELAKALNVTRAQVWQWLNGVVQVSAERCIEIEKLTSGEVTCEELRPDVDWAVLRNSGKQQCTQKNLLKNNSAKP
jgi:uncharacterized protein ydaS|nr:MAG TPA: Putative antitoxin of bacterial toxin-antitoxin system, YdaS/YdaT [Bacteriophage sp.]DAO05716.1 MAG TPA: Putative antitoxin of bacterial toxin-antitoxin system, YdaS/YdaT [Bacteriophage sp.]